MRRCTYPRMQLPPAGHHHDRDGGTVPQPPRLDRPVIPTTMTFVGELAHTPAKSHCYVQLPSGKRERLRPLVRCSWSNGPSSSKTRSTWCMPTRFVSQFAQSSA
jgi:hypothetical protein